MGRSRTEWEALDLHVGGEPGRVILAGGPEIPVRGAYESMRWLERHGDGLRRLMLREPRGYPAANCNLLVEPAHPEADAAYVIMEQVEYPAMSGTNTIAVATALIEAGRVEAVEPVTELKLESPAGLLEVSVDVEVGRATAVTFRNVPAFVVALDHELEVPELGTVRVDVAWGGMFFVIVDAAAVGVELAPRNAAAIARVGEMIKAAAAATIECVHPEDPTLRDITIAALTGPPSGPHADGRNAVVVSTGVLDPQRPETWTGALDRSPCGTGTCARMAVLHARGQLAPGQDFRHEGILGTVFTGRLLGETTVGDRPAVIPTISGRAWLTSRARYVLEDDDPFPTGFRIGDIWGGLD